MIKVSVVSAFDLSDEYIQDILDLSELHWKELAEKNPNANLLKPPNHNPQTYMDMEKNKQMFMVLVEDVAKAKIVGYCINLLVPDTFHPGEIMCHAYGWYLHEDYRKAGYGWQALECSKHYAKSNFNCRRYNMAIHAGDKSLGKALEVHSSMTLAELVYTQRL